MPAQLIALSFVANDPGGLGRFWSGLLGWDIRDGDDGVTLLPTDDTGFQIRFTRSAEPRSGRDHLHLHLTSTSLDNQRETVAKALALGAQHIDVGQRPEEGHRARRPSGLRVLCHRAGQQLSYRLRASR